MEQFTHFSNWQHSLSISGILMAKYINNIIILQNCLLFVVWLCNDTERRNEALKLKEVFTDAKAVKEWLDSTICHHWGWSLCPVHSDKSCSGHLQRNSTVCRQCQTPAEHKSQSTLAGRGISCWTLSWRDKAASWWQLWSEHFEPSWHHLEMAIDKGQGHMCLIEEKPAATHHDHWQGPLQGEFPQFF